MRFKDLPFHDGSFEPQAEEATGKYPFHYLDGVTIRLSEVDDNPDDDFLGRGSLAEQSGGDEDETDDPAN